MAYNPDGLLKQYFPENKYVLQPGKGGMNNTTLFVETEGNKYVLRIYQTHRDMEKVKYEHYILTELGKMELPFGTPLPVQSLDNETIKFTDDMKLAALFHYMEGTTPDFQDTRQLKAFGRIAGNLTCALKSIKSGLEPVYRPYYDLENAHPKCSIPDVIRFCEKPSAEFGAYVNELLEVAAQLAKFRDSVPLLEKLPHQLVHGDLNASNVLADAEGNITAVLDFEFVTEDLRVMELSVCLSEIINMRQSRETLWKRLHEFLEGYGSRVKLTPHEIQVIPVLIMLRRLDVFIHFLGRFWEGIDSPELVAGQIKNAVSQSQWLEENDQKLISLLDNLL